MKIEYNKEKVDLMRNTIRKVFLDYYMTKGYAIHKPLPLRIDYDPSLSFVNCSICIFKKAYLENKKITTYCVSQPALRTNTFKSSQNNEKLVYTAALEMLGAFTEISNETSLMEINKHFIMQAEFLNCVIGSQGQIEIEISPLLYPMICMKTVEYLLSLKMKILISERELKWHYGMDNIWGIGSNWKIKCYNQRCEYGNVILLFKDNKPIGVESGGAIEALLRCLFNFPHKIFANTYCNEWIAEKIEGGIAYSIEYFDALNVLSQILWHYKDEKCLRLMAITEKYIRILKSIMILSKISLEELEKDIKQIERTHEFWCNCPNELFYEINNLLHTKWNINMIAYNYLLNKNKMKWRGISKLERKAIIALSENY